MHPSVQAARATLAHLAYTTLFEQIVPVAAGVFQAAYAELVAVDGAGVTVNAPVISGVQKDTKHFAVVNVNGSAGLTVSGNGNLINGAASITIAATAGAFAIVSWSNVLAEWVALESTNAAAASSLPAPTTFLADGTVLVPAGARAVIMDISGNGGGGGGGAAGAGSASEPGGGAGGAGPRRVLTSPVTPGQTLTVGGISGGGGTGGAGGVSGGVTSGQPGGVGGDISVTGPGPVLLARVSGGSGGFGGIQGTTFPTPGGTALQDETGNIYNGVNSAGTVVDTPIFGLPGQGGAGGAAFNPGGGHAGLAGGDGFTADASASGAGSAPGGAGGAQAAGLSGGSGGGGGGTGGFGIGGAGGAGGAAGSGSPGSNGVAGSAPVANTGGGGGGGGAGGGSDVASGNGAAGATGANGRAILTFI